MLSNTYLYHRSICLSKLLVTIDSYTCVRVGVRVGVRMYGYYYKQLLHYAVSFAGLESASRIKCL